MFWCLVAASIALTVACHMLVRDVRRWPPGSAEAQSTAGYAFFAAVCAFGLAVVALAGLAVGYW